MGFLFLRRKAFNNIIFNIIIIKRKKQEEYLGNIVSSLNGKQWFFFPHKKGEDSYPVQRKRHCKWEKNSYASCLYLQDIKRDTNIYRSI